MSRANLTGMRLHQALSFSPMMMRIPKAPVLFWPGCALLNLDGAILYKTLHVLQRIEPDAALAAACCGQPTRYLFAERFAARQQQIIQQLQRCGVQRIYTACPNCTLQLRQIEGIEVLPIWPALAQAIRPQDLAPLPQGCSYVWHDPCPTRKDFAQQQAVRKLLSMRGCDFCEPAHTAEHTICCGNFHMTHTLRPEISQQMRLRRISEFPDNRIIASSCEGCLGSFRAADRQGAHLLELLFGQSQKRGWQNRIRTTLGVR